jgi:hypothetical protein
MLALYLYLMQLSMQQINEATFGSDFRLLSREATLLSHAKARHLQACIIAA